MQRRREISFSKFMQKLINFKTGVAKSFAMGDDGLMMDKCGVAQPFKIFEKYGIFFV